MRETEIVSFVLCMCAVGAVVLQGCSSLLSRVKSLAEGIVLVRGRAVHVSVVALAQMRSTLPAGLPEITDKLNRRKWSIGSGTEQVGQSH